MSDLDFEEIHKQIFDCNVINEEIVTRLLLRFMNMLYSENNVIVLSSPIVICGDIHGQVHDLVKLFQVSHGFDHEKKWTNKKKYLFMGNYVGYGRYSLNTFLLLVTLKLQYPDQISLLRGNFECRSISYKYGFYDEILKNYGYSGIYNTCTEVFDLLPLAAIVDQSIFCVHGGISPDISLIERIQMLNRQTETPISGPITDLLWSDPDENVSGFHKSERGIGVTFGKDECTKFIRINRLKMICRSNQVEMNGYKKYFGEKENRLISIFSAPNFKNKGNLASVMHVNDPEDEFKRDDCPFYLNVFDKSQEWNNQADNE